MPAARSTLRALVLAGMAIGLVAPATAAQAEPSVSEIQQRIDKASATLEEVVESHNKVREELKETKAAAAAVAAKIKPLEADLAASGELVGDMAVTAYKTGQVSAANALLSPGSTDSFVDRLGMLDQLARERQRQVSGFTEKVAEYEAQKQTLVHTEAKQQAQARELAARKKKIEADLEKLYDLRRQAYGRAQNTGTSYSGSVPSVAGSAGAAVRFAYGAIGTPYSWGAAGPGGYDCSGLTMSAWRAAGRSLPHNAAMQWNVVSKISRSQLQPGDLVFYNGLAHVGIYVGSNQIIHAPTFGETVTLASVDVMPPYGYGRVA